MSEAVQTMASPAATWAIVVIATILALFMATATMFADIAVARAQRRERRLGIGPAPGALDGVEDTWPRLSEALVAAAEASDLAAAGHPAVAGSTAPATAAAVSTAPATAVTRHDIPAQRSGPAQRPEPAREPAAAQYAGAAEAEAPTEPIPAPSGQGPQDMRDMQDAPGGRHSRAGDDAAGEMPTRPDLPAQRAPAKPGMPMPVQRSGESDRAERSFAGPAPQDDDEDEQ